MKVHSIVDIITNSSTELFVMKPKDELSGVTAKDIGEFVHRKYRDFLVLIEDGRYSDVFSVSTAYESYKETYGDGYTYQKYDKGDILVKANDSDFSYEFQDVLLLLLEKFGTVQKYHLG